MENKKLRPKTAQSKLAVHILKFLQTSRKEKIVHFNIIRLLRRMLGEEIYSLPLFTEALDTEGRCLENQTLSMIFSQEKFDSWSLDVATLNLIFRLIKKLRVKTILELGSGISTVCFAQVMKDMHAEERPYVHSIEQDQNYVETTRQRLSDLNLNPYAEVYWAPLEEQVIEGVKSWCYRIQPNLNRELKRVCPDLLIIDGPAGKKGVRYGTVPLVKEYMMEGSFFLLDDALRDEELKIASRWNGLSYIKLIGIYLTGKGLLAGKFEPG